MMDEQPEYVTTREQDEYGHWYRRTVGPGNFLSIVMDKEDVERMMAYQREHPPKNLTMFAKSYEKIGNMDFSKLTVEQTPQEQTE